jgi:hypothetical protein
MHHFGRRMDGWLSRLISDLFHSDLIKRQSL